MYNILYLLTRGGVPRSLGGVPEIVVDMPIAGDDVVTMAGDEDARPDGLGSGASLNPESVDYNHTWNSFINPLGEKKQKMGVQLMTVKHK